MLFKLCNRYYFRVSQLNENLLSYKFLKKHLYTLENKTHIKQSKKHLK